MDGIYPTNSPPVHELGKSDGTPGTGLVPSGTVLPGAPGTRLIPPSIFTSFFFQEFSKPGTYSICWYGLIRDHLKPWVIHYRYTKLQNLGLACIRFSTFCFSCWFKPFKKNSINVFALLLTLAFSSGTDVITFSYQLILLALKIAWSLEISWHLIILTGSSYNFF